MKEAAKQKKIELLTKRRENLLARLAAVDPTVEKIKQRLAETDAELAWYHKAPAADEAEPTVLV
jgi:hypothetical protein